MKKAIPKTIILLLLILASIYQIITLWFDSLSDRNFFYSFFNIGTETESHDALSAKKYILEPRIIGIYLGTADKDFTSVTPYTENNEYEGIYSATMTVMKTVLSQGDYSKTVTDNSILWKNRGVLLTYDFPINKSLIADDFNLDENKLGNITDVIAIAIIPAVSMESEIRVCFIQENLQIAIYELNKSKLELENKEMQSYIDALEETDTPVFISTYKDGVDLFAKHTLLPVQRSSLEYSQELIFSHPFVTGSVIDEESLTRYIDGYFENPEAKGRIDGINTITYWDDNAIIKYNTDGLLDYSSIEKEQKLQINIPDAYRIAEQFLQKDTMLQYKEYYLKSYTKSEEKGSAITFSFGYMVDGLPLYMSPEVLEQYEMSEPMEIVVSNGKVIQYRRVMTDVKSTTTKIKLQSRFQDALDAFMNLYPVETGAIEDMSLGYAMDTDSSATAKWILTYGGKKYTLDLE